MKKSFLFKSLLLLVSVSCISFTSCGEDEPKADDQTTNTPDAYENNNSFDSAEVIVIGNLYECNLQSGDVDYFKIEDLTSTNVWDNYEIQFTNEASTLIPTLNSYDYGKTEITSESMINQVAGASITKTLMLRSGNLNSRFIKISGTPISATEASKYKFKVVKKNDNESTEPNQSYSDVINKAYTTVQSITGKCMTKSPTSLTSPYPDIDYVKITIPQAATAKVLTYKVSSSNNANITYDVYKTSSNTASPSTTIATNVAASASNAQTISGTTTGATYVYLKIISSADQADYTVDIVSIQ